MSIDQRDQAQEKAAMAQAIFDEAAVCVAAVGLDKRFLTCNRAFCEFLGYSEDELRQKTIAEVTFPDDAAIGMADLLAIVAGERRISRVEKRYVRKDGAVVWGEVSINLIRDGQGQPLYLLPVIVDLTERKRAEAALRENELKYRALFETAEGAILLFADGRWVDCNARASSVFGATREQIIGAHPSRFSPPTQPDGRPSEEEAVKLITLAFTTGPQSFEWEHCRMDGTTFAAEVNLNRVELGGKPHIQAIVRDVSERKRVAEALKTEKANLDAIFESSPVGMMILDATTEIVMANAAIVALSGGSQSDMLQHRPGNALRCIHSARDPRGCGHGPECPLCPARRGMEGLLANGGTISGAEVPLQLVRNGEPQEVWLRIGAEPILMNGQRHLCVAMEDITSRKRAEEELRVLNTELEQCVAERTAELKAVNQELEAFSYSVSHDLRAPLRSVDGYAKMLQEDYAERLDDEGRRLLQVIRDSSHEMGQLISDLLAFSRLSRKEMKMGRIGMSELAAEAKWKVEQAETGRAIRWDIGELPPAFGDKTTIQEVLINLIANAVKYTRPRQEAAIGISGRVEGDDVVYSVTDNGVGFDMAYKDKLFNTFQRLHTAAEFEGTGIGLSLVQRIVQRHSGRVWAEGKVNEGATFYFTLPCCKNEKDEMRKVEKE